MVSNGRPVQVPMRAPVFLRKKPYKSSLEAEKREAEDCGSNECREETKDTYSLGHADSLMSLLQEGHNLIHNRSHAPRWEFLCFCHFVVAYKSSS